MTLLFCSILRCDVLCCVVSHQSSTHDIIWHGMNGNREDDRMDARKDWWM